MSKTPLNALAIAAALAAAILAVQKTVHLDNLGRNSEARERCYGIARAGKNDCGTPTHSCAALSKINGDAESWIMVPRGLCNKLVGGHRKLGEG